MRLVKRDAWRHVRPLCTLDCLHCLRCSRYTVRARWREWADRWPWPYKLNTVFYVIPDTTLLFVVHADCLPVTKGDCCTPVASMFIGHPSLVHYVYKYEFVGVFLGLWKLYIFGNLMEWQVRKCMFPFCPTPFWPPSWILKNNELEILMSQFINSYVT